jgi:hypothetical protein
VIISLFTDLRESTLFLIVEMLLIHREAAFLIIAVFTDPQGSHIVLIVAAFTDPQGGCIVSDCCCVS